MTTNEQLELGFNGLQPRASHDPARRPHRPRELVVRQNADGGGKRDGLAGPSAEPRPEQIWMPGANREVKV
jgi:hypothetical protein